jgi:hypothetical protein
MPWLQWWNFTTTPPLLDGYARWNNYVEFTTGGKLGLDLPPFMGYKALGANVDELLKAGPYAFKD